MTWNDINLIALRILTRWWIVVIITTLVVGVSAWRVTESPETYRATVLLVVSPDMDLQQSEAMRVADLLNRDTMMSTYVDVLSSPLVVGSAMVTAGEATIGEALWPGYEARAFREPGSNVLRLIAEGPEPVSTVALVEHMHWIGAATLTELYPMLAITPLTTGSPQAESVGLSFVRVVGIGLFVGLIFGLLIALWFDSLLEYRSRSKSVAAPVAARPPTTVDMGPAGQQVVTSRRS